MKVTIIYRFKPHGPFADHYRHARTAALAVSARGRVRPAGHFVCRGLCPGGGHRLRHRAQKSRRFYRHGQHGLGTVPAGAGTNGGICRAVHHRGGGPYRHPAGPAQPPDGDGGFYPETYCATDTGRGERTPGGWLKSRSRAGLCGLTRTTPHPLHWENSWNESKL